MHYTKTPWNRLKDLTPDQWTITRIVGNLDDIATSFETRWGVGRLPELVSAETRAKWDRHMDKLNAAIDAEHPDAVLDLALGAQRGWAALEAEAMAAGHEPLDPNAWDVVATDGTLYRVFRTMGLTQGENGISVQELVNVYHANRLAAFSPPPPRPAASPMPQTLDDEIPL